MINSVLKAIDIINLFSAQEPRLTLAEISRRTEMPKSTVHNILNTLVSRGFVERAENDHYALGTAIVSLTHAVRVNVEVRDRAAKLLRELADRSHESVYLTVLDGDKCLYVYAIESSRRLLARTAVGDHVDLHCTAVGKAILAFLPTEQADVIIARVGQPRFTAATITDLQALREELVQIRLFGFAIDRGEHEVGTFCIGAPFSDGTGRIIGACSLSGTDPAIIGHRLDELAPLVVETAHEISRRMGYVPKMDSLRVPLTTSSASTYAQVAAHSP